MGKRKASAAYRELGEMLRRIRENAGLTAAQLSEILGWSAPTISRMEHGWRHSTEGQSRQFAAKVADVYDRGSQQGVADVLAQEHLQRGRRNRLCGSDVEKPTALYE